jgi:hypothetical protein
MNRVVRSAICGTTVGLAVAAAMLPATTAAASPDNGNGAHVFAGQLRDLQLATDEPLEGASARLTMANHHGSSTFVLNVKGIDVTGADSAAGHDYGAHLHLGPCVSGDGAAALPHYNTDVLASVTPPTIDETTEVWLDFTVTAGGTGHAVAHVPFVAIPGDRAIVIHRDATNEVGVAGPRLACLPVSW